MKRRELGAYQGQCVPLFHIEVYQAAIVIAHIVYGYPVAVIIHERKYAGKIRWQGYAVTGCSVDKEQIVLGEIKSS